MMKRLLWLGICLLSTSWLFSIHIFNRTNPFINITLIFFGTICIVLSSFKYDKIRLDKRYYILFVLLIIPIILLNYPLNIGLIVLTIGIILLSLDKIFKSNIATKISFGIIFSGIILCIQTAFLPLYEIFISHGHRFDLLSGFISFFGNILGLKTSVNNGVLFISTAQNIYPFTTTFEKLGFFVWFNIFIASMILFFLFYSKRSIIKPILIFFIISFFYLIIRYISYIYLYVNSLELEILWDPILMLLSFIPFTLILMKFITFKNCRLQFDFFGKNKFLKKKIAAFCLFFVFIFTIIFAFTYQDPGKIKEGRILIDEYHSDWEYSIRPLDKIWYGLNSTYNYYSLAKWLNNYYEVDQNIDSQITLDSLLNYDILILKCPTNSYSYEEIESIVKFVNQGGGLYLIGDHTDVFGMNTFLNQVAAKFGIKFNMDATYEIGTGKMTIFIPDKLYSHPIVHNLEKFEFMTSCTLNAPLNSENVIIGNRLIAEPGTYSTENFFRESIASPESEYGLLLQVVAVKSGKGRVVAFSDSTVFSSFSIFSDGYQSFTFGAMEYLNRENIYSYLNTFFIIISIISLIISIYLLKKENKFKLLFLLSIIGFFSLSIALPIVSSINHINYTIPQAHTDFIDVGFDQQYSNFNISLKPSIGFFEQYDNFGTFYVWTQRVNCTPNIEKSLDEALEKDEIIVFINPIKKFETKVIEKLTKYVKDGGSILILDSITSMRGGASV